MTGRIRSIILAAAIAAGASLTTTAAAAAPAQLSAIDYTVRIWNVGVDGCILVQGSSNNAPVVSWSCSSTYDDQKWNFVKRGYFAGDYFWIVNKNSSKCLLTQGAPTSAVQYTCMDYADQHWWVDNIYSNIWVIQNRNTGMCLTARATGSRQAYQATCDPDLLAQKWILYVTS